MLETIKKDKKLEKEYYIMGTIIHRPIMENFIMDFRMEKEKHWDKKV
jgi:hypothetical protein